MAIKNDIWKLHPKIDGLVCCKTVVVSNYNSNLRFYGDANKLKKLQKFLVAHSSDMQATEEYI